jgi:hypothetical protein
MLFRFLRVATLLAIVPTASIADPMPSGAKNPTPSQIEAAYIGRTDLWTTDCAGGIYFGANNQARAWCSESRDSLGAGTWSVDNYGRLCHELTWYWPNDNRAGSSPGDKTCVQHVVDRSGHVWRSYPGQSEWWPVSSDAGLVPGYKFQGEVVATQRRLGL